MALFNFNIGSGKESLEDVRKRLAKTLAENQVVPQQQVGAFQPGEVRPEIAAKQQGTSILSQIPAQQLASLISQPELAGVGNQQLNSLLANVFSQGKPAKLKPTEISTLRNQAKPIRVAARDLRTNFDSMRSSFEAPKGKGRAAADLAMVISFAKMLDPTSVVRSEEGETIQKTGGLFGKLNAMVDQIKGSGSLDINARTGLMLEAGRQFQSRFGALAPDIEFFSQIAIESGVKPGRILTKDLLNPSKRLGKVADLLKRLQGELGTPNKPKLPPGFSEVK